MKRYVLSAVVGAVVGFAILFGSSCVKKTGAVAEVADAGAPDVVGAMAVGAPTIEVNPQVTDSVTQSAPAPESK